MAAHRLARHLARIRTGDEEPTPAALRAALRDVVRHCIYGVDINPMAVELCKVALWMETLDPGKPLSFLDRNIQCGNSLIGATPQGLEDGIPDAAFAAVTGDDKAYCSEFKKLNKKEREQQALFTRDLQPWERLGNLAAGMAQLDATEDDTLAGVQRQEALYEELVRSSDYRYGRLLADAWCAAFVWQKTKAFAYPITEQVFRAIERNPFNLPKWMAEEIERLAGQYQFFHWHLAFPHVFTLPRTGEEANNKTAGWCGGFDVVCGNPPWERIKLQEQEFFADARPGDRRRAEQGRAAAADRCPAQDEPGAGARVCGGAVRGGSGQQVRARLRPFPADRRRRREHLRAVRRAGARAGAPAAAPGSSCRPASPPTTPQRISSATWWNGLAGPPERLRKRGIHLPGRAPRVQVLPADDGRERRTC